MNIKEYKIVIMAGGKGSRIQNHFPDIPKPMIPLLGKPILEHQILHLKDQGAQNFTIVVGYLQNSIVDYFGNGQRLGVKIEYIRENQPLGTAGALKLLSSVDFPLILINGDLVFDISVMRMIDYHIERNADITLLTHPNDHPFDSALIETDSDGKVVRWYNKEDIRGDYKNRVNAGIHILSSSIFNPQNDFWQNEKVDLDRDIIKPNLQRFGVYAYDSPEYVKDMGTLQRYEAVIRDYTKGIIQSKNLTHKQKAIFMDRDGTINVYKGFVTRPEQFELMDAVARAIKRINESGYLAIVVTNQPVIARGECTIGELKNIHMRMERLLGEKGAYVDDISYCPHHPDKGFKGEILEYKIDCSCRKPKPGMLLNMTDKFNIDLNQSYMIGDDLRDILAGKAAGCHTVYIGIEKDVIKKAEFHAASLFEAVNKIL